MPAKKAPISTVGKPLRKTKPLTLHAQDPINVTGTGRSRIKPAPSRIPVSNVLDDIVDMGMSSPAEEAPSLQIFEIDLEYVANLKGETGTMAAVQRSLASTQKHTETLTLVVSNTNDLSSPELEDPKRGLLVDVPVSYMQTVIAGVHTETQVPAKIALYARCAAGRFQEDANDLIRVTAIKVLPLETRELIYTL